MIDLAAVLAFLGSAFATGIGPGLYVCSFATQNRLLAITSSIPIGIALQTQAMSLAFVLGYPAKSAFWPVFIVLLLVSGITAVSVMLAPAQSAFKRTNSLPFLLFSLYVAVLLALVGLPRQFAPAEWSYLRLNPGDERIYLAFGMGTAQLSYQDLVIGPVFEVHSRLAMASEILSVRGFSPTVGLFLNCVTSVSANSLDAVFHAAGMSLLISIGVGIYAVGIALRLSPWAYWSMGLVIATGFWPLYIFDMTAYAQLLQTSISIVILFASILAFCWCSGRASGNHPRSHQGIPQRLAIGLGVLFGCSFTCYREFSLAVLIPAGIAVSALAWLRGDTTVRGIVRSAALCLVAALLTAAPSLDPQVLLNALHNLRGLVIDGSYHFSWVREQPFRAFWGLAWLPCAGISEWGIVARSLVGAGGALCVITSLIAYAGLFLIGVRMMRDPVASLLVVPLCLTVFMALVFGFNSDWYRCGKALGYLYFLPVMCIAYGTRLGGQAWASCSFGNRDALTQCLCRSALVGLFVTHLSFNVYYASFAVRGLEVPSPYPTHPTIFHWKRQCDPDFQAFDNILKRDSGATLVTDIRSCYESMLLNARYTERIVGSVNAKIDTDYFLAFRSPHWVTGSLEPTYVLASLHYASPYWERQGLVKLAQNRTTALLWGPAGDVRRSFFAIEECMSRAVAVDLRDVPPSSCRAWGIESDHEFLDGRKSSTVRIGKRNCVGLGVPQAREICLYIVATRTSPLPEGVHMVCNGAPVAWEHCVDLGEEVMHVTKPVRLMPLRDGWNYAVIAQLSEDWTAAGAGTWPAAGGVISLREWWRERKHERPDEWYESRYQLPISAAQSIMSTSLLEYDIPFVEVRAIDPIETRKSWGRVRPLRQGPGRIISVPGLNYSTASLHVQAIAHRGDVRIQLSHNGKVLSERTVQPGQGIVEVVGHFQPSRERNVFEIRGEFLSRERGKGVGTVLLRSVGIQGQQE